MNTEELRKEFCEKNNVPYTDYVDILFHSLRNCSYEEICELIGV